MDQLRIGPSHGDDLAGCTAIPLAGRAALSRAGENARALARSIESASTPL